MLQVCAQISKFLVCSKFLLKFQGFQCASNLCLGFQVSNMLSVFAQVFRFLGAPSLCARCSSFHVLQVIHGPVSNVSNAQVSNLCNESLNNHQF